MINKLNLVNLIISVIKHNSFVQISKYFLIYIVLLISSIDYYSKNIRYMYMHKTIYILFTRKHGIQNERKKESSEKANVRRFLFFM